MNRRTFLRSMGAGAALSVAGCLSWEPSDIASVAAVETRYPTLTAAQYDVWAEPATEPDESPMQFESLSRQVRIEVANAIGRGSYLTDDSPAIEDADRRTVAYRGSPFAVHVGVSDGVRRRNPDVPEYVTLDARIEGKTLEVAIRNDLHERLTIVHGGRPYFGVLTAVHETATLLHHDRYDDHDGIRTTDGIWTEPYPSYDRTATIEPGRVLRESYRIRDPLPDGATIWLAAFIRSDPIDLSEAMTGTITIEA